MTTDNTDTIIASGGALSPPAVSWIGGDGGNDWSDGANWSGGEVPAADADVTVAGADTPLVTTPEQAGSLTVAAQSTVEIQGGALSLTGALDLQGGLFLAWNGTAVTEVTAPTITIESQGSIFAEADTVLDGNVVNNAPRYYGLTVEGGPVQITGSLTGFGVSEVVYGSLEIDGAATGTIILDPASGGTLKLGDPADFGATVTLSSGDLVGGVSSDPTDPNPGAPGVIDLLGVQVKSASYDGAHLSVVEADGTVLSLAVTGADALSDAILTTTGDGNGGTDLYWQSGPQTAAILPSANPGPPADTTQTTTHGAATTITTYAPDGGVIQTEQDYPVGTSTVSTFANGAGVQTAAVIVQHPGAGETVTQHFDGAWNQLSATIATVNGDQTVVQDFDGSWTRTDASIITVEGAQTIVQQFDGHWTQTSAVITQQLAGGVTETQHFDANWVQTSANLTTDLADGDVLSQEFDASWNQTGATLVSHPDANETVTQHFDAAWNQTSATVATVGASETVVQSFDANWNITGSVVTEAVNSATVATEIQTLDAYGDPIAAELVAPDGSQTWFQYSAPDLGPQTFTAATTHSTTFVLQAGEVAGDTIAGLHSLNLGGAIHDVVELEGFGAGAHLTQIDATHWEVVASGLPVETFAVTGGAVLGAGDYFFH